MDNEKVNEINGLGAAVQPIQRRQAKLHHRKRRILLFVFMNTKTRFGLRVLLRGYTTYSSMCRFQNPLIYQSLSTNKYIRCYLLVIC